MRLPILSALASFLVAIIILTQCQGEASQPDPDKVLIWNLAVQVNELTAENAYLRDGWQNTYDAWAALQCRPVPGIHQIGAQTVPWHQGSYAVHYGWDRLNDGRYLFHLPPVRLVAADGRCVQLD